jgi:hypothetical protein
MEGETEDMDLSVSVPHINRLRSKVTSESEIHELGAIGHQDSEDGFDEEGIPRKAIKYETARLRYAHRFVTGAH